MLVIVGDITHQRKLPSLVNFDIAPSFNGGSFKYLNVRRYKTKSMVYRHAHAESLHLQYGYRINWEHKRSKPLTVLELVLIYSLTKSSYNASGKV